MPTAALVPTTGLNTSPTRTGFCQRCGDPVSGKVRCTRCGGTSKEPNVHSTSALPAAKKQDPWANRYCDSSFNSTADGDHEDYLHNQPPLSPKRASYDPSLGFGMPSRISRDLRTSNTSKLGSSDSSGLGLSLGTGSSTLSSSKLSPLPGEIKRRPVSQDYTAPIVKGSDGVLSKVCGSLVEPSESRNRWSCADCASVFARDATLYAAPPTHQHHDQSYYCRDCYAKRYSLGSCHACGRDVLGSTKEDGKYVKASAGIWHGKCWKCTGCSKGGEEIMLGMDGNPTCEACFGKPRHVTSAEPQSSRAPQSSRDHVELPDVRRLSRTAASRNGPMGATISELTKKLGAQSISSPSTRAPFTRSSSSNTSMTTSSSSKNSLNAPGSPIKSHYAFPVHVATSPGKTSMTRSGSITGSPPKPRPLTAPFRDGLNLAAFKPTFPADAGTPIQRKDSRSRSSSPVKRPEWTAAEAKSASKVPGSPSLAPVASPAARLDSQMALEPGRQRTSSGFPRPLNSPFAEKKKQTEPVQGEKPSPLESVEGTVRCAVCHLLPFERTRQGEGRESEEEVVMVTLSENIHLHADCFRCSICHANIDGSKTFVRLQDTSHPPRGEGLAAYAHTHCSPTINLVQTQITTSASGQKSYRTTLEPAAARSHPTHQRELKPSPAPSPTPSVRSKATNETRPSILAPSNAAVEPAYMRRSSSQQSTSSSSSLSTLAPAMKNPAAGIFSRLNQLSSASGASLSPAPISSTRLGGMNQCAFCGEKVTSLESVLGPRGTQWHKTCLICRAPAPPPPKGTFSYGRKEEKIICGKKLDSGAKVNADGEVRCRDCYGRESSRF